LCANLPSSLGGGDEAAVLAGADDIANGTGDDEDGLEDIVDIEYGKGCMVDNSLDIKLQLIIVRPRRNIVRRSWITLSTRLSRP
jgi:hypothetical protein